MLKLPIIALFLRTIPEGIVLITASYYLSNTKIIVKRVIISGALLGMITYVVRLLSIHYGVHTIICLICTIILLCKANHFNIFKAITSGLMVFIIICICDLITVFVYLNLFHIDSGLIFNYSFISILLGMPSLLFTLALTFLIQYIIQFKRERAL